VGGNKSLPIKVLCSMEISCCTLDVLKEMLCLSTNDDGVRFFELVQPRIASTVIAKSSDSRVTYTLEHTNNCRTSSNRIRNSHAVISVTRPMAATFAMVRAFYLTHKVDLGFNPVLDYTHHSDVVCVSNIHNMVNVQHDFALNCVTLLHGGLRNDLRSLKARRPVISHDMSETHHGFNKNHLKYT
jgi:hypothetical protein